MSSHGGQQSLCVMWKQAAMDALGVRWRAGGVKVPLDAARQSPSEGKSLNVGRACKALTQRSRLSSSTPALGHGSAARVRAVVLGNAG